MSTSRPFAYNPTGGNIPGTEQIGDLAVGLPTSGFGSTSLEWWNGPEEETGYVVAKPKSADDQPTTLLYSPSDGSKGWMTLSTTYRGTDISLSNNAQTAYQQFGYQQSVLCNTLIDSQDKVMFSVTVSFSQPLTLPYSHFVGIGRRTMNYQGNPYGAFPGNDNNSMGYGSDGNIWYNGIIYAGGLSTFVNGDIIDIAINNNINGMWVRVNGGDWNNNPNEDPATDSGSIEIIGGSFYPVLCPGYEGTMIIQNTATYGVPSGYTLLGTNVTASVGFSRTNGFDDNEFIGIAENLLSGSTFNSAIEASDALTTNGYWNSYVSPVLYLDASSYSGSGGWIDSVGNKSFSLYGSPEWVPNTGSIGFVGSSQYISTSVNAPSSTSITYEWWFYQTNNTPANQGMLQTRTNSSDGDGIDVSVENGSITVSTYGVFLLQGAGTVNLNTWHHIALVRNGSSSWTVYLDGSSIGGTFAFSNTTGTELVIGRKEINGSFFQGYISNFRYVKEVAVYTSNFTPSTKYLTSTQNSNTNGNPSAAITGTYTQLLLNTTKGNNFLVDSSSYTNTITNYGTTSSVENPFIDVESGYFKFVAANDQFAECSTSLQDLTTWTVSVWHYYTGNNLGSAPCIVTEVYPGSTSNINYSLGNNDGGFTSGIFDGQWRLTSSYTFTPNNWYYIVGTFTGSELNLYVNDTLISSANYMGSSPISSQGGIRLMRRWDLGDYWGGNIANVSIYDRALTTGQISSAWNLNKDRFGL